MHETAIPELTVKTDDGRAFRFSRSFQVGRAADCDVQIDDHHVSRRHLQVEFADGHWTFSDLQSANGVFANQSRVETGVVAPGVTLRLGGLDGPSVSLRLQPPAASTQRPVQGSLSHGDHTGVVDYEQRYFGQHSPDEPAGPRTMMIREAFQKVQKRQRRSYLWVLGVVAVAGLSAGVYALYLNGKLAEHEARLAQFYAVQEERLQWAKDEQARAEAGKPVDTDAVRSRQAKLRNEEAKYRHYLDTTTIYGRPLTEEEKLILKVTRTFGECELIAPDNYLREVSKHIGFWKGSQRFPQALRLAKERGYVRRIVEEFEAQNLPPEFLYLAMQESNFHATAIGPPTRLWGHAKGMWQFIADTGKNYGLRIGPAGTSKAYEADDERFHWEKATRAAARYIKTIYATDAQASGLLVMASYNWGEGRVIKLIRELPENPRDRNFWQLLERYRNRIPDQTYGYVFHIVAAAVIGENPRHFGFDFDNPIAEVREQIERSAAYDASGARR